VPAEIVALYLIRKHYITFPPLLCRAEGFRSGTSLSALEAPEVWSRSPVIRMWPMRSPGRRRNRSRARTPTRRRAARRAVGSTREARGRRCVTLRRSLALHERLGPRGAMHRPWGRQKPDWLEPGSEELTLHLQLLDPYRVSYVTR